MPAMSHAANDPTPLTPASPPKRKRKLLRSLGALAVVVLLVIAGFVIWRVKNPRPDVYALIHISRHTPRVMPVLAEDRVQSQDYRSFGQ